MEISLKKNTTDSYVIAFPDIIQAQQALSQADAIGYNLVQKRLPRPSPTRPCQFKALSTVTIRSGKGFRGDVLGKLKKDDIVTVNQKKGRRVRLMIVEEGSPINKGWVSLYTAKGFPLLEQLE